MKEKLFNLNNKLYFILNKYGFLIGLFITLSLLWPLIIAPYFSHHDDVQIIRLYEMNKCISDNQLPCRWVPDLGGLYGYPLFNYYAPFPYYFGELIYLISNNLIISAKLMFALPFLGAYLFMYLLGRKIWGNVGGTISGIFYTLAPYHAVSIYVRGAMGEVWALMLFPLILLCILKLKERIHLLNILFLSISISLLILSHNLSTMIFLPIICFFVLLLFWKDKNIKFLESIAASLILGLILAAFYWMPMIFEKNLVHVESTTWGYFSYTEHFKGLRKLIFDHSWGWGASVREVPGGEKDGMSFQIGWIHLLGWLLALYLLKNQYLKVGEKKIILLFSSAMILISIFLVHPRSEFIWKLIEPMKYIQFPWRFLMIIILFISLAFGSLNIMLNKKIIGIVITFFIILVVIFNFTYFRPEKFIYTTDQDLLSGINWEKQIKRSIFDFLPIYTELPPRDLAQSRYQLLTGDTEVIDYKEGSNWVTFKANTKEHTIIRLSQYYFPNWQVKVDGQEVNIDYKNSTGLITFILGVGNHQVEARLLDTLVRCLGNLISAIGFGITALLLFSQIPLIKKWLKYYFSCIFR